jgi:DNA (cytosine-5)-methyltransferase 1
MVSQTSEQDSSVVVLKQSIGKCVILNCLGLYMQYRLGEYFSGPGGMALGAISAMVQLNGVEYSIVHEWACDYDSSSCMTYRNNISPENPKSVIEADVSKLKIKTLSDIDIFAFGFPCNDFSSLGESKGLDGDFGNLYKYGLKLIRQKKPSVFVAENVDGITNANDSEAWKTILDDFKKLKPKYDLYIHHYHFEKYGVPQRRHRYIIIGFRSDLNIDYNVPQPTTPENFVTTKEALTIPPIDKNTSNHEFTKHDPRVVERLKTIPPGGNAWSLEVPDNLRLKVKSLKMSNIYRRQHPDQPAYTVTGSGGGGTHGYHYSEPRALTNRENARLQSFPDNFIFSGGKMSVRKQIGMAVPPEGARIIFESVLKSLGNAGVDPNA